MVLIGISLGVPLLALLMMTFRRTVSPYIISFGWLWPVTVGLALLVVSDPAIGEYVVIYMGSLVAFVIGYGLFHLLPIFGQDRSPPQARGVFRAISKSERQFARRSALIVVLLASLHFSIAGIPLLMANVESARWGFTNSGLLGIPGRAVTTGFPLVYAWLRTTDQPLRAFGGRASRTLLLVWLLSSLATGFKSGVLQVAALASIVELTVGRYGLRALARMVVPMALLALLPALLIGGLYDTYTARAEGSVVSALIERSSTDVAEVAMFTMEAGDRQMLDISSLSYLEDAGILLSSYARGREATEPVLLRRVSGLLHGVDPSQEFAVPTTPTGPAVAYANFGPLTLLFYVVVGLSARFLELGAQCWKRGECRMLAFAGVFSLHGHLISGGTTFGIINYLAFAILLVIFARVVGRIGISAPSKCPSRMVRM